MSVADIDRLGRFMNNLYTAVFERPKQKFNQPFRNVLTASETLHIDDVTGDAGPPALWSAPKAVAYAALTVSGTYVPADGFVDGGTLVSYGSGALDETQMWLIAIINPTFAYNASVSTPGVFRWAEDASHYLMVVYDGATDSWKATRRNGGTIASASVAGTHAANDLVYLAVQWTATDISISVGQTPSWTTVAGTEIPTLTLPFYIGTDPELGYFKMNTANNVYALGRGNIKDITTQIWWLAKYAHIDGDLPGAVSANVTADPVFSWGGGTWWWESGYFGNGIVADHEPSRVGECNAG